MRSSKLRDAFKKVLNDNKIKHSEASIRQRRTDKISYVCLSVLDAGSAVSSPSLTVRIHGTQNKAVYLFNPTLFKSGSFPHIGHIRSVFFTSIPEVNPALGGSLLITKPGNFQIHGPPGSEKELDFVYSSLYSRNSFRNFKKSTNFVETCESEYADEFVTIKKLLVSSDQKGPDSEIRRDTIAYSCLVKDVYRKEVDFQKLREMYGLWSDSLVSLDEKILWKTMVGNLENGVPAYHPTTGEPISDKVTVVGRIPPKFLVLECPTMKHFSDIERSELIHKLDGDEPNFIAHMTPECVLKDTLYQNWMRKFDDKCIHLILNKNNNLKYDQHNYYYQSTLHGISPALFPAPKRETVTSESQDGNFINGRNNLGYVFSHDEVGFQNFNDLDNMYQEAREKSQEMTSFAREEIENLQQQLNINDDPSNPFYFPRLSVLGCGSSQHNKYRSQPGFLLRLSATSSIVIDCGCGSLLRIHQQFGEEAEQILASINVIFISHIHIDHHLDLLPLVRAVVKAKKRIKSGNKTYCLMTNTTRKYYDVILNRYAPDLTQDVACEAVVFPHIMSKKEFIELENMSKLLGVDYLRPVVVKHGVDTHGLVLVTKCGKKIVYSSDTMPMNHNLIRHGRNADFLIHDCLYMEDAWELDATIRRHSYLKGALATSEAMNAKFTMLTHFTAFLPVVPPCDIPPEHAETTALANDFLNISISDLHHLPKLRPVLETVFEEPLSRFLANYPKIKQRQERKMMQIAWTARNL